MIQEFLSREGESHRLLFHEARGFRSLFPMPEVFFAFGERRDLIMERSFFRVSMRYHF